MIEDARPVLRSDVVSLTYIIGRINRVEIKLHHCVQVRIGTTPDLDQNALDVTTLARLDLTIRRLIQNATRVPHGGFLDGITRVQRALQAPKAAS